MANLNAILKELGFTGARSEPSPNKPSERDALIHELLTEIAPTLAPAFAITIKQEEKSRDYLSSYVISTDHDNQNNTRFYSLLEQLDDLLSYSSYTDCSYTRADFDPERKELSILLEKMIADSLDKAPISIAAFGINTPRGAQCAIVYAKP